MMRIPMCSRELTSHQGSALLAELARRNLANMDVVKGFAEGGLLFLLGLLFRLLLRLTLLHGTRNMYSWAQERSAIADFTLDV